MKPTLYLQLEETASGWDFPLAWRRLTGWQRLLKPVSIEPDPTVSGEKAMPLNDE